MWLFGIVIPAHGCIHAGACPSATESLKPAAIMPGWVYQDGHQQAVHLAHVCWCFFSVCVQKGDHTPKDLYL